MTISFQVHERENGSYRRCREFSGGLLRNIIYMEVLATLAHHSWIDLLFHGKTGRRNMAFDIAKDVVNNLQRELKR